jgi:hypothetical protein
LHPEDAELPAKLVTLREYLAADHDFSVMKLTKNSVLAALKVSDIHKTPVAAIATALTCKHEPEGDGDPHTGIHPSPGVANWPTVGDAPEHLAIQQFLFQSVCHAEAAILPNAAMKK